jgi:hypothetical protein
LAEKAMTKLIAGLLIAAATMAGMYAVATTTATALASSFTTEERTRPTRIAELETAMKRAVAGFKAARGKCDVFSGKQKHVCNAEARAEEIRGVRRLGQL